MKTVTDKLGSLIILEKPDQQPNQEAKELDTGHECKKQGEIKKKKRSSLISNHRSSNSTKKMFPLLFKMAKSHLKNNKSAIC